MNLCDDFFLTSQKAIAWALTHNCKSSMQQQMHAVNVARYAEMHPIKFHIGIFEFGEDAIKGAVVLVVGLGAVFAGVHLPVY